MRTGKLRALNICRCVFVFMGLVLAAGLGTHAWAQLTTARLGGMVLDPAGLGLPGATVTAQDELTTYKRDTTTNSSGEYLFPVLPVNESRVADSCHGQAREWSAGTLPC